MSGHLSLRELRLKDRTRALQEAAGGLERSAEVTGKSKSQHGRCQNPQAPDFLNIADVADLEANAQRGGKWPQVTRLLCEFAGGVFLPLPDGTADEGALTMGVIALASEFGDVAAAAQDGAADGRWDAEELLRLHAAGRRLQVGLAGYLNEVERRIEAMQAEQELAPGVVRRVGEV